MDKENNINHVGIIMDGNGRWAKALGKPRSFGHKKGSENVDRIAKYAFNKGIKTLTLYAFSTENWKRPKKEVDGLMKLLKAYFNKFSGAFVKNKVRLNVIGDLSKIDSDIKDLIKEEEQKTKHFNEHILNIALNYGGRQEIVYAVNKLIEQGKEITEQSVLENLQTAEFGEPDLIIRTGGEIRISNFMLYQSAYSELYFTDVLWPDFDENEFEKAIENFSKRKRNFGKV